MQESYSTKRLNDFDDEIRLQKILYLVFKGKWTVVSITAFFSIIGVIYSLSLPNIYESKALLVPVEASSGISGALRNSSLAGLVGAGFPSTSEENNSLKAKRKISSLSFFQNNILPNIFLPDLMAISSWDLKLNVISYNNSIYDNNTNTWVREYSYPRNQIPSAQEAFKVFNSKHLSLSEDNNTGFITISIKHQSPFVAKQWADLVVDQINIFYRLKDKSKSEKAVSYLNEQIKMTGLSEIKEVIAELLQEETKKLTLIEANKYYVFDYIDPPAVMESKSEPNRALFCILAALLGVMLGVIMVLIRHIIFKELNS